MKRKLIALVLIATLITGLFAWYSRVDVQGSSSAVSSPVSCEFSDAEIKAAALDIYTNSTVSEKSTNYYEISYPGSGSKISIGDKDKTADFKTDLTISTWNGEAEFKLISPVDIQGDKKNMEPVTTLLSDRIVSANSEWIFTYKPTEPIEGFNEKGGIDIFITALEKPKSNRMFFASENSPLLQNISPGTSGE
jgi:hypothetical protein